LGCEQDMLERVKAALQPKDESMLADAPGKP
jgi:hypothetical protein